MGPHDGISEAKSKGESVLLPQQLQSRAGRVHSTGVIPTKHPANPLGGPGGCCTLRKAALTSPKAEWTGVLTASCWPCRRVLMDTCLLQGINLHGSSLASLLSSRDEGKKSVRFLI